MVIIILILILILTYVYWPYISIWFQYRKNYKIISSNNCVLIYEIRDLSPPELIPGTKVLFRISAEDLPGIIKDVSEDGVYYNIWSGPIVYSRVTKKMIKGILHERKIIRKN